MIGGQRKPKTRHKSLPINEFQRYHLNQWTRTEEESWIEIEKWLACQDEQLELEPGLDTFVGVDMALRHDSVAIVYGQKDDNEIINMLSKIWLPNDENFMDLPRNRSIYCFIDERLQN